MTCTKEELKNRIEATKVASNGSVQFGPELRRDIVEYAKEQQAAGHSKQAIAEELGMRGWTLDRWCQNERKLAGAEGAAFVEVIQEKRGRSSKVKAVPVGPTASFNVTCPSGFEVRVPSGFEANALRRLLQTLEGH